MKIIIIFLVVISAFGLPASAQETTERGQTAVAEFYLARDDGSGRAGDPVSGFFTTDVPIYCVVQLDSMASATVQMNLLVISVPGVKAGTKVVSASYTTKENQNRVNFSGRPDGQWVPGRYRADIYVGTKLAVSREFAVLKTIVPKPAAEGINRPKRDTRPRSVRKPPGT